MKKIIAIIFLATMTQGCNKFKAIPNSGIIATHQTWIIAGQSNADRFAMFGGPDAFNRAIQGFHPGTITWINCAVGGTAISQWKKGQPIYDACIAKAQSKVISGIIWDQGEAEAEGGDITAVDTWAQNFTTLAHNFRHDLNPILVIVYARLGQAKGLPLTNEMREAQGSINIINAEMANLDDIPVPPGLHYNPENYPKLAQDYANAYYTLAMGK